MDAATSSVSAYEQQRLHNIARNEAMLEQLGLANAAFSKPATSSQAQKKRPRTTRVQSSASLVACPHVQPAVVRWAATPGGPVFACCCD